jgi:hypothetical protein
MTITVQDHGLWSRYKPDPWPADLPESILFCRRESDAEDWYQFARAMPANTIKATVDDTFIIQAVSVEADRLFPQNCRLIEITGSDAADNDAAFAAFNGKLYDPTTTTIGDKYEPAKAMPTLTRKQVILGLLTDGFISASEAVAAAQTGAEPAAIKAIFDGSITDPVQRATATVTWASMRDVIRTDSLTRMIQASRNMSDADTDAMWLRWSAL